MLLENLELFIKTCEYASISKAANELHFSRSTISTTINNLEKEFGKPLLTRSSQGIVPTEAGQVVLEKSREIQATYETMLQMLEEQDTVIKGTVSVGLLSAFSHDLINSITAECAEKYPDLDIQFYVARFGQTPHQLIDMLTSRKVSIAFGNCYDPKMKESAQWDMEYLYTDHYHIIVPEDHPLAKEEVLFLSDLQEYEIGCTEFIYEDLLKNGYITNEQRPSGISTFQIGKYPSADSCFRSVKENGSIGIAPLTTISNEKDIRAIPLADVDIDLFYVLIYPKKKYITLAEQKFIEIFKKHYENTEKNKMLFLKNVD